MGGNQSKQTINNEVLNDVMMNVMTKNSTGITGSVDQSNTYAVSGVKNTTIGSVTQSNSSKINVSALMQSVASNTLQAELTASVSDKIKQETPVAAIGNNTTQAIDTIVENAIKSNITTENMQTIAATVKQKNSIVLADLDNVTQNSITQKNEATLILELVNTTSSEIITGLKTNTDIKVEAEQKPAALLPDFGSMYIILFIILIVIFGGGMYYLSSTGLAFTQILAKPQVIALIAGILGVGAFMIYNSSKPKET
jgi:membrane-associated HD superfamily phosphohydrolase